MSDLFPVSKKVNLLFRVFLKFDGKSYTNREVAEYVGVSIPTLVTIRNRPALNPTLSTLQGICKFFGVPLDYFNCETEAECLDLIKRVQIGNYGMRTSEASPLIRQIIEKTMRMSSESQQEVLKVVTWIEDSNTLRQEAATS